MFQERVRALDSVDVSVDAFDPIYQTLIRLLKVEQRTTEGLENKQEVLLSIAALISFLNDESKLQEYQNLI